MELANEGAQEQGGARHSMQIGTGARGCTSQYANWFGSKGVHVTACKLAQGREGARHSMQIGTGARGCTSQHANWFGSKGVLVTACKLAQRREGARHSMQVLASVVPECG